MPKVYLTEPQIQTVMKKVEKVYGKEQRAEELNSLAIRIKTTDFTADEILNFYEINKKIAFTVINKKVFKINETERQELAHDCSSRLIEKITQYNPDMANWTGYAYRVITNYLIDLYRKDKS